MPNPNPPTPALDGPCHPCPAPTDPGGPPDPTAALLAGLEDYDLQPEDLPVLEEGEDGEEASAAAPLPVVAVVGRHVDQAGATVRGDELARQERPRFGIKPAEVMHRVAGDSSLEGASFEPVSVFSAELPSVLVSQIIDVHFSGC